MTSVDEEIIRRARRAAGEWVAPRASFMGDSHAFPPGSGVALPPTRWRRFLDFVCFWRRGRRGRK